MDALFPHGEHIPAKVRMFIDIFLTLRSVALWPHSPVQIRDGG